MNSCTADPAYKGLKHPKSDFERDLAFFFANWHCEPILIAEESDFHFSVYAALHRGPAGSDQWSQ